jgi:hypothetical protein
MFRTETKYTILIRTLLNSGKLANGFVSESIIILITHKVMISFNYNLFFFLIILITHKVNHHIHYTSLEVLFVCYDVKRFWSKNIYSDIIFQQNIFHQKTKNHKYFLYFHSIILTYKK